MSNHCTGKKGYAPADFVKPPSKSKVASAEILPALRLCKRLERLPSVPEQDEDDGVVVYQDSGNESPVVQDELELELEEMGTNCYASANEDENDGQSPQFIRNFGASPNDIQLWMNDAHAAAAKSKAEHNLKPR
jgi:hypothetical protein